MPVIPGYDNFMMFIVSFLNKIYFIDDSCAIHRWSGEHNVSSIGNQQPFVVRQYYRTKMLVIVLWRVMKYYLLHKI